MPNVGALEIAIVVILALIVFGPSKLPQLARSAGSGLRELKQGISGHTDGLKETVAAIDPPEASSDPAGS